MPLRVDQLSLGPMGTNCYVVRPETSADEAVVVDPSGDATELRLTLARLGARCTAILVTHGHWDHLLGVADLAEGTGAPVHMAEGERMLLEEPGDFTPPGVVLRPYVPDVLLSGGETLDARRHRLRGARRSRALARPPRVPRGRLPLLGRRPVRGLGRPHGLPRLRLGDARRVDSHAASTRSRPTPSSIPGHGPTTTLGAELARNPFLAELRAERAG